MRTIDFSTLFRHSVGFDRMQRLLDSAARIEQSANTYPPYNIEHVGEDGYRISLAVAGFGEKDLDVTVIENTRVVSGKLNEAGEDSTYLHPAVAPRALDRRFAVAYPTPVLRRPPARRTPPAARKSPRAHTRSAFWSPAACRCAGPWE